MTLSIYYSYAGVLVQYTNTECTRILITIMYIMLKNKMAVSIRDAMLVLIILSLSDVIMPIMLSVPYKSIVLNETDLSVVMMRFVTLSVLVKSMLSAFMLSVAINSTY